MARYFRGTMPSEFLAIGYFEWAVNVAAFELTSEAEARASKKGGSNVRANSPHIP
jgi:hypothetical protein